MKKQINIGRLLNFLLIATGVILFQSCEVYSPVSQQTVTVPDIVQMSKDGLSSKQIIRDIRHSHTVYRLKADQLAKLRDEGVQDSVINYMQKTHLDAIRYDQRMADLYYGWTGGFYGYYGGFGFGWPYGYYGYGWGPTIIYRNYGGGYRGGFHGSGGHGAMHR